MTRFLKAAEVGTGGARTLPGRFYHSPEIFLLEQERIFAREWLYAGREEAIAQPGEYFVLSIGHESIIVLRDQGGELRAFYNVCRHRGTRICTESGGKFSRSIQCPYHAWTYALDGRLLGAPGMEGLEDFDKRDYSLQGVNLATWQGFVFISLAANPRPFEEAYAPLWSKFERYQLAQLRAARRIDYDVQANWKLIFENYSECYHCPAVHPALVKLSPADSGENDLTHGAFLGGFMTVSSTGGSMSNSGRACGIPVGSLTAEDLQRVYYYSIFPNMLLSLHHDYVMVHRLTPCGPDRTTIECEWLFHPDSLAASDFDPLDAVGFWDTTNRQDWRVCELSHQGTASRAYTPGPYSPRESISAAFDRHVLESLGIQSLESAPDEASRS